MKYEISNVIPSLLDFVAQKKLYLPRIKYVEVKDYSVSYIMDRIIQQQDASKTDQMIMYYENRKHNPDQWCVNVSLKSAFADPDVVATTIFKPIAELREILNHNWLKKGQTGYTDLMFILSCNPEPVDALYLEIIEELKEFSKKHGGLNYD